ncbi:hypothetical protein BH11VER1_BH11VER1_24630 [soil metagenome]
MPFGYSNSQKLLRYLCTTVLVVLGTLAAQAAPVAPTNLRGAIVTSTSFNIIWDDNSTDETSFEMVYTVNGITQTPYALGGQSPGTGTISTGFSGLTGWNTATIQIRAKNAGGTSTPSNAVSLTFNTAFNAPNSPLIKVQPNGSILVMWTDNASSEAGYIVEYATASGGPFTLVGSSLANYTGLYVDPLAPATIYYFRIKAYQGGTPAAPAATTATTTVISATTPTTLLAPTSLVVTSIAPTETSANFSFSDNTGLNNGYEFEYRLIGAPSFSFLAESDDGYSINGANLLEPGTAYEFRCRAYYYNGISRAYSGYSNTASLTTPFIAPTSLSATQAPSGNGNINLTWADNSAAEGAYAIYIKKSGATAFTLYNYTAINATSYSVSELEPGTNYEFQVAAAYQAGASSPVIYSGRSNSAFATTPSTLLAPTGLAATALTPTESSVKLTFADNTTLNVGYEIEGKYTSSTGAFGTLGDSADGTTINMPDSFEPGTSYDFRIRAFYEETLNSPSRVYSGDSNIVAYVTPFHAPTVLATEAVSDSQINLSWTDNSEIEIGYAIYARVGGTGDYGLFDYVETPNLNTYHATGLWPGAAYEFLVTAVYKSVPRDLYIESDPASFSATTKDGFTSAPLVTFHPDGTYAYTATTSQLTSSRTTWSATNLPAGVSFNTTTGEITGTPTVFGVFNATLSATFSDGRTTTLPLTFRIIRPPAAPILGTTIGAQTLALGGSYTNIPLADKFSDPDSESAVRVVTNVGTMDFILYNNATPQTVTNFLSYVNALANNYNGTVFHRSASNFFVQGGAFKVLSAPNYFSVVPTSASPLNEPGISNLRGTVAMAKQGGDPNSATNQFFVNLGDNSGNLDFQNGGFTAFARVANGGMTTADAIAALPRKDYAVNLGATATTMADWPLTSTSTLMDTTKVVTMTSVAPVAVLSYSVQNNTNATAVSVTVNGTDLVLHALSGGQSTITLRATDLDGQYVDQTFSITVNQSANAWAASQGLTGNDALPDADPDHDGSSNFHEFAFMSLPNAGSSNAQPSFTTTAGATKYGEITFPVRKFTTGLTYIVEASGTLLPGSWTTLWTSSAGFLATNVVLPVVDQSDRTIVTIRDTAASPPALRRFLRVRVTGP